MTTKRMRSILLLWAFVSSAYWAHSQTAEVKVSVPKVVSVNEPFQLVYTLGQRPSGFQQPDLGELMFSGPSMGSQSSTSIVNGKVSQESRFTYTYVLQAPKEGKFTISAAKFVVDGKTISADPITIEVVKGKSPQAGRPNPQGGAEGVADDDLFAKIVLDKTTVYAGEAIVASIKIYTRVGIAGFQDIKFPPFTGFWAQELETPKRLEMNRENINGTIYEVGLMRKNLLLPNGPGRITIDPAEMEVVVNYRVRPSSFWDDGFRQLSKKIKTNSLVVNVQALPEPKPQGFGGAVGTFRLKSSLDKPKLKTNDAATIKIEISGTGNLNLVKAPDLKIPPDFEAFDTKESQNIKVTATGTTGTKTFDYVLIPRHHGQFEIPAVQFSYFDLASKSYKTIASEPYQMEVEQGEGDETVVSSNITTRKGTDVKVIQDDIRYIDTDNLSLTTRHDSLFGSTLHWLFFVLVGLGFGVVVLLKQKQIRENKDLARLRNRRAGRASQQRLKKAKLHMDKNEKAAFFEEVLRALWGYLSDKLTIDLAELTKERASEVLLRRQVSDDQVQQLMQLIDQCEFARYAPVQDAEIGSAYDRASQLINHLEQKL